MPGHVAASRTLVILDNPLRRWLQPVAKIVAPYVRPGMTVLDVGCGHGGYALAMAQRVGPKGKVVAADLQRECLEIVARRAARAGLSEIVETMQCEPSRIGLDRPIDFALAFFMVHETPSPAGLFAEIAPWLTSDGRMLMIEPRMHVSQAMFDDECAAAAEAGLTVLDRPKIFFSRAALLGKTHRAAHQPPSGT